MTALAAALALATGLPANAQVTMARPLLLTKQQAPVSAEQQQWVEEQVRRNPGITPAQLGAAARQRFTGLPESSYEYLIQLAGRLNAGDHQKQQDLMQAQLAELEAQKRALAEKTAQKQAQMQGSEAAPEAKAKPVAAADAYIKMQRLRMPAVAMDSSAGTARLVTPGQLVDPGAPPSASGDATAALSPSLRAWVKRRARAVVDSGAEPDPNAIAGDVRTRLDGQEFSNGDIEAISFIVMMEASRQAQDDLHDIMEQTKAANARKAQQREAMAAQKDAQRALSDQARAEAAAASQRPRVACVDPPCLSTPPMDSMSEMGEMESLRLQMAMDRRSKLLETLSNIMKKSSDTASTITSNLK